MTHSTRTPEAADQPSLFALDDLGARCVTCGSIKPDAEFYQSYRHKSGLSSSCRDCNKYLSKMRRYGITRDEYDRLFALQGGLCAICKMPEVQVHKGVVQTLSVDHDHDTGMIRGLLCHLCNHGLGQFRDRIDLLEAAIDYLKRNGAS